MNVLKLFILFGFSILFLSCDKDEDPDADPKVPYFNFTIHPPGDRSNGSAQASVFGKNWEASTYIHFETDTSRAFNMDTTRFSIILETHEPGSGLRDFLQIAGFRFKTGEYKTISTYDALDNDMYAFASYSIWRQDGDVLGAGYNLDTKYDNRVWIDKADPISGEMSGRFSLLFTIEDYYRNRPGVPKQIFFKEGRFTVRR